MHKIKKIAYCIITIILLLSILSLTYFSGERVKPTQHWNAEQIKEHSALVGYSLEYDEELKTEVYKSLIDISHIILPHDGSNYNTVVVKLAGDSIQYLDEADKKQDEAEDVAEKKEIIEKLYYNSDDNGFFVSGDDCDAYTIKESNTLVFRSYNPAEKNTIALNINYDIRIEEISVYMIESGAVTVKLNPTALIVLCVTLLLLLICEKRFGYFAWIKSILLKEKELLVTLSKGDRRKFVIHILSLAFTAALVIGTALLITLNYYTATAIIVIFALSIPAVAFQIIDRALSNRDISVAKLFLVVSVLIGIMMCYTSPTSTQTAWDDEIHLRNSYFAAIPNDNEQSFAKHKIFDHSYFISNYMEDPSHFARTMVAEDQVATEYSFEKGNLYTLLSYSPMIAITALLGLLSVDIVKILVLCRFAMLLTFVYICYRGIRKLQGGGLVFAAICLLPGVLYLACSISYDSWLTAWMLYAFASVFSVLQRPDKKFTAWELAKILIALFLACSPKSLYCVMLLPLLFISKNKFRTPKQAKLFRVFTVLTIVIIAAILIIPGVFVYDLYTDSRGGENVDSLGQIIYILTHPIRFAGTLLEHLGNYLSLSMFNKYSTTFGFLDGYEGNLDLFIGTFAGLLLVFCLIADRKDEDICTDMRRARLMTLLSCLATVAVVSTSMYIAYNDVGASGINGCQFRYLFPLLAPAFFFLRPKFIRCDIKERYLLPAVYGAFSFNLFFGYLLAYIYKIFIL